MSQGYQESGLRTSNFVFPQQDLRVIHSLLDEVISDHDDETVSYFSEEFINEARRIRKSMVDRKILKVPDSIVFA